MKKQIIIAVSLLTLISCTKKSSTTSSNSGNTTSTSTTTASITFQGNTYTYNTTGNAGASTNQEHGLSSCTNSYWEVTGGVGSTTNVDMSFSQFTSFTATSGIGTYYPTVIYGTCGSVSFGTCELIDYGHGSAYYYTDGNDTTSYVTITVANSTEYKGSFSLKLNNGSGVYSMATGSFDVKN